MRIHALPVTLMLMVGLIPAADPDLAVQERLPLAKAVALALEHNPDLAVDAPVREAARAELSASRAGLGRIPRLHVPTNNGRDRDRGLFS